MNKKFKAITVISVLVVTLCILLFSINLNAAVKGFQVDGTNLLDANGNVFVMRGVNHAHTWYKNQLETAIPAIAKTESNTVRIVLSDGVQWTKDTADEVDEVLKLCEQYNLITVLEVHDATGYDDIDSLLKAANYFIELKDVLEGREDKVIINIANEWYGTWGTETWTEGYKKAIPLLRDAGFKHTILVDCAGWGQYPTSIHEAGKEVFASDIEENTMFAFHGYEYSAGEENTIKNNIDLTLQQGLCLTIGEFGGKHTSGDVDEDYLMSYCDEKGVGWLAWSWKGNSDQVAYLDLSNNWEGTDLTDWGNRVVNGPNGIKETSKICSIFDEIKTATVTTTYTATSTIEPTPSDTSTLNEGQYSINYNILNDWGSGSTVNIVLENNSVSDIEGWILEFSFLGDETISNMWNGDYTQTGTNVTVSNVDWNSTIKMGKSVEFGFNITYFGSNEVPESFILNGVEID